MLERSLEIAEVLRGGGEMMKTGSRFAHILEKGLRETRREIGRHDTNDLLQTQIDRRDQWKTLRVFIYIRLCQG